MWKDSPKKTKERERDGRAAGGEQSGGRWWWHFGGGSGSKAAKGPARERGLSLMS